jgi:threonylcarbamoyladenosine tRNA methylthiotransferase MtaB
MKVYLDTIGCRLNQAEIEAMARQFRRAGHEISASAEGADLAVVNTCAVTAQAASDSRQKVRQAARLGAAEVVVTGCWATLAPAEAGALPNVRRVVANRDKDGLVPALLGVPPEVFDLEPLARAPLPGLHRRTRAFIKVQDGCDNRCTFCVTTIARGAGRSRPLGEILAEVRLALAGGTKEIVLTGVHLGSWGQDFGGHLRQLVAAILRETDVPRLRLSSLEPWDLDAGFFSLWENPRLCRHLHLPLQSGCSATLRRMARKTTPDSFRALVSAARSIMPEVALTTDVIAGFPGESRAEFRESLEFAREMDFAGGHAFTYSPRPGTAAARMPGQVRPQVGKERNAAFRTLFEASGLAYREKFIGRVLPVLWESTTQFDEEGWRMEGWSDNHLRIQATAPEPLWNEISPVRLGSLSAEGLAGSIVRGA